MPEQSLLEQPKSDDLIVQIWNDPEFIALDKEVQIEVMNQIDPDFYELDANVKERIIDSQITPKKQALVQSQETTQSDKWRTLTRLGGSTVGAIAGIPGGVPGSVLGAGLGGAGAEGLYQIGQQAFGDPNAPKTSLEAAKRIAIAGGSEAALEATGSGIAKGLGKVLAPYAKKVTPKAKAILSAFKSRLNPALTPSEATKSWSLDLLQNISEASIFGGGKMATYKELRSDIFKQISDELIDQFGERVTPIQFGEFFTDIIEKKVSAHKAVSEILYNKVDDLLKTTKKTWQIIRSGNKYTISEKGAFIQGEVIDKDTFLILSEETPINLRRQGIHTRLYEGLAKRLKEDYPNIKYYEGNVISDEALKSIKRYSSTIEIGKEKVPLYRTEIDNIIKESQKKQLESGEINIKLVQDFAKDKWRILDALQGLGGENAGEGIVKSVMAMDETIDFETAKTARSLLLDKVREISVVNKKAKAIGIANEMIDLFDSSIEASLKESGNTEALQAWRTANTFYRKGKESFDNEFTRTMIKKALDSRYGAEAVGDYIFKPGNVTVMNNVKKALGEQNFKKVRSISVQKIFRDATDNQGNVIGTKLQNALTGKKGSYGDDLLNATFSQEQIANIRQFADALTLGQAKQAQGTGSMFIQLKQAQAVMALGSGIAGFATGQPAFGLAGAGIILFSPDIVSRMLLNPKTARWLTEGVKLPASSPHIAGLTSRILGAYWQIKYGEELKILEE